MHSSSAMAPKSTSPQRIAELVRLVIDDSLAHQAELLDAVDAAVLSSQPAGVIADPVLVAAIRRTLRSHVMTWVETVHRDPFADVVPSVTPEALAVAAEFRRRGLLGESITAFRSGQAEAWRCWTERGAAVIDDPTELSAFLTHSARSIYTYIDAATAAIDAQLDARAPESPSLADVTAVVVGLLADGGAVDSAKLSLRLGYELAQAHRALVLWGDGPGEVGQAIESAVAAVISEVGPVPVLVVPAPLGVRWVWVPDARAPSFDVLAAAAVRAAGEVRLVGGLAWRGVDGFRRSHREALAAQRVVAASRSITTASWSEVEVVGLLLHDQDGAQRFVERTLGDLRHAEPQLLATLRAYLRNGSNASRTAEELHAHRNTVLDRLRRAEAALPRPIDAHRLDLGAALEILHWSS